MLFGTVLKRLRKEVARDVQWMWVECNSIAGSMQAEVWEVGGIGARMTDT